MRASIPEAAVGSANVTRIDVGQVAIGPVRIGQLEVDDLNFSMSANQVRLTNFRVTVSLEITLDWRIHIEIPIVPDIDEGGTVDIGRPSITIPFGNISVSLDDLTLRVDNVALADIAATANPLRDLHLGRAVAENIRARNVIAPVQDFQITGLTFTSLQTGLLALPGARLDEATIGRVHGDAFPLGELAITGLAAPAAVQEVRSQGIDVSATQATRQFHADLGILELTLNLTPGAQAQIDTLIISGANAAASIGAITMRDIVAPYELLNLTLSDIGLEVIEIPSFGVTS